MKTTRPRGAAGEVQRPERLLVAMPAALTAAACALAACAPSLADDLRGLPPASPAPARSASDSLLQLVLGELADRCDTGPRCAPFPLLADSVLSAATLPASRGAVFVFVTRPQVQELANRHDAVWYHYLQAIRLFGDSAVVVFGQTVAVGVRSPPMVDLGSGVCRWVFRRTGSQWVVARPAMCVSA